MNQAHAPNHRVQQEESDLWTVAEVASQLRCDQTTVRRWIKSGALDAITLPHRGNRQAYRVRQSTMGALLKGPQDDREA